MRDPSGSRFTPGWKSMICLNSRVQVPDDVLFCDLGDEAVLLSQKHGQYYALDEIGARMWALLTRFGAVEPAVEALEAEYAAAPDQIRGDVLDFVEKLESYHLLVLVPS